MSAVVSDYGWQSGEAGWAEGYLIGPVLDELRKCGAKRVLDIGCGNGALTHRLQKSGFEMTGCDADARGVEIARKSGSGAKFHHVGVDDPPERIGESGFDAAVSTEVVEHLFTPRSLPRFAKALLKPGGTLIITTPYHGRLKNTLIGLMGKWDSHHGPLHDGGHIKFWSAKTLRALLEECGYNYIGFRGAGRIPYLWKSMVMTARSAV